MKIDRFQTNLDYSLLYLQKKNLDIGRYYNLLSKKFAWGEKIPCLNLGYWKKADNMDDANIALFKLVGDRAGFSSGDIVVDAGCGFGYQDVYWLENYQLDKIIGLNISSYQQKYANEMLETGNYQDRIRVDNISATELSNHFHGVNKIIALESAFHFQTREKFFTEAYKALAENGRLIIADIIFAPNRKGIRNKFSYFMNKMTLQYQDDNMYALPEYLDKLKKSGFKNIKYFSIQYYVYPYHRSYLMQRQNRKLLNNYFWLFRWWMKHFSFFNTSQSHVWDYVIITAEK
jgi:cyclopropane fatty-acyl-phospholipid synthase-like methyltransferase